MKKKVFAIILAALLVAALLTGCVESLKQDAISTEGATTPVVSNGGLAVQAGDYVYYINGYSGNDADNTFGNVQKGAIVRAKVQNGVPDPSTNVVIVPKIVYNTLASSGLYIEGGYLYYTTPNTDKNSSGTAKYTEMNLMRTKLDGTDTQIIKKFSDYTASYVVTEKGILYYLSNELHFIDVNSKKFNDTLVAEGISANYFVPRGDGESKDLAGMSFFTKYSDELNASHQIVYAYRAGEEKPVEVINGLTSYENPMHLKGYTFTLVTSRYLENGKVRLIYRKSDGGSNTISAGTYSYDFDKTLAFDETKEEQYVRGTSIQYTNLYFLSDTAALATTSSATSLIIKENGEWQTNSIMSYSVNVLKIEEQGDRVLLYYIYSSKIYRLPFAKVTEADGQKTYSLAIVNSDVIFQSSYHSSWLQPDLIGDVLYFFNSNVLNYTYTYELSKVVVRDTDTMVPKLLSMMTAEDEIAMLTA